MLELVVPAVALEAAWREAHAEWGPGAHEDGFGLDPADDVDSAEGFADWVSRLVQAAGGASGRCSYRWIVDDGTVLGGIALGHQLDAFRLHARGQVGFGVRPSARGRGVATWALRQMLRHARDVGLDRVLLICAEDNVASARTIERCGGVLEDVRATDLGRARRYWIELAEATEAWPDAPG
jgi:predicted acetyltransferase